MLCLFLPALLLISSITYSQVDIGITISAGIPPPALPVYTQPPCPYDGYLWTPGYWAYDNEDGYYWVPGVWVRPPQPGFLWTPCYWGYSGGVYGWHPGYWGREIGFYGGVNYGYGYGGSGFYGGRWEGNSFRYNTAVVNVNRTVIHNTYIDRTVIRNTTVVNNRTSFNGGPGGISARPSAQEQVAMRDRHAGPTSEQSSHQQLASRDRNQFARVNNGRPAAAAMNTVNGQRFNPQGHAAPAVVARTSRPVGPASQHGAAVNQPHAANASPGVPAHAGGQPNGQPNNGATAHTQPSQPHIGQPNQPHTGQPGGQHPTEQHTVQPHNAVQPHPVQPSHPAPQQRPMPQQQHAPQQQHPVPQQHAAPQQHPMPQQHAAPQRQPAPQPHPQPPHNNPHPGGGGGEHREHR